MVYYNLYYVFLFLWSLVWTLEVKNDKGLPLYPAYNTHLILPTFTECTDSVQIEEMPLEKQTGSEINSPQIGR